MLGAHRYSVRKANAAKAAVVFCEARYTLRASRRDGRDVYLLYPDKALRSNGVVELVAEDILPLIKGEYKDVLSVLKLALKKKERGEPQIPRWVFTSQHN